MSYYKTKKKYGDMNLNELLEAKQRHITNPKYYLKLVKPPFYYTWMNLLQNKINKRMLIEKP